MNNSDSFLANFTDNINIIFAAIPLDDVKKNNESNNACKNRLLFYLTSTYPSNYKNISI